MRLDADDDSVKGRFSVATWKAAFCDCGDAGRGAQKARSTNNVKKLQINVIIIDMSIWVIIE